ncbi:hypothetical protein DFH11DRAFT_1512762 [Phellopilus nigrolimitatus]|nr:hypothetical protein DFH11DRAFT_1512762 [Phellopilus nigrolimitatus]
MQVDSPVRASPPLPVSVQTVELHPPSRPASSRPARPPPPPKVKVPRPVKLKPLKEVLSRLIANVKRKDDYAFFLQPVDQSKVTGYSDVVKHPMDFGTMTEKVEKGRYRSLEQFKDDFCLVTSNAKAFNPPGSLYHVEASKIEAWGIDQITRSSTQVIEYETDWTIDVVADEEPVPTTSNLTGNSTAEVSAPPMTAATSQEDNASRRGPSRARSPSVVSSVPGMSSVPVEKAKRSSRAKKAPVVTESWEEGGHLPGFKDGIGAFPPCSEEAALMIELKLRGKKFRTKKERLKREKEGPPLAADGSLDYTEMEHPFTILQQLVPDPPSLPNLVPLISTQPVPPELVEGTPAPVEGSQTSDEKQDDQSSQNAQGPIAVPPKALSTIFADAGKHNFANPPTSTAQIGNKKLRHWTILRNPPRATRAREEEDDGAQSGPQAKRRRVEASDYGPFATLLGTLAAENGLKADNFEELFGSNEKILQQIRTSIERREPPAAPPTATDDDTEGVLDADEYIRDVVYGGVDGLAYFRSLAEFVGECNGRVKQETEASVLPGCLGMPLAQWVETHIVDELTQGNHAVLRATAHALSGGADAASDARGLARYLAFAGQDKTGTRAKMRELQDLADPLAQIDIAALLHAPDELFVAENEWAGREYQAPPTSSASAPAVGGNTLPAPVGGQEQGAHTSGASVGAYHDTAGAIEHALLAGAEALRELGRRMQGGSGSDTDAAADADGDGTITTAGASAEKGDEVEVALARRTRLNLIAVAKRAPIDRIARLPPELVPLHIRHIVPTLGS